MQIFGHVRVQGIPGCNAAWCGSCYQQAERDVFPVLSPQDLDEALVDDEQMDEEDDRERFREAPDGDHLLCLFRCDACHFPNMQRQVSIPLERIRTSYCWCAYGEPTWMCSGGCKSGRKSKLP